jgi:hypothetical protein
MPFFEEGKGGGGGLEAGEWLMIRMLMSWKKDCDFWVYDLMMGML